MKLLIVDDEMQIRTGLELGIEWNQYGFTHVYTAENGVEALELCEQFYPEIIITDIRMPVIDGIEFVRRVREMYKPVEVILLSGYSDFEYAREAIKLGAFDYFLKPTNIEELVECVKRAQERIRQKRSEKSSKEAYHMVNRMCILQQTLMSKDILSGEEVKLFYEQLSLEPGKEVVAGVCSVDILFDRKLDLLGEYIEEYMKELLVKLRGEMLYWERGNLFFLLEVFSEVELERKIKKLEEEFFVFNNILKDKFQNTVTLAISTCEQGIMVPRLFRECEELLKQRLYKGPECFLTQKDILDSSNIPISPIKVEEIRSLIRGFDYERIRQYLEEVFQQFEEMQITSIDFVRGICLEFKNLLLISVQAKGIDLESIFEYNQVLLNDIPNYVTLKEYYTWIDNLYFLILQGLTHLAGKQHNRVIIQAVDYISKNYSENINLETTAEYVQKSKNYFSYLFKKEMGISFIEYLNSVRVEQAKKILETTDAMTYEVAEQVGYSDYKYFSSVFKKITGMSAAQYRRQ